MTAQPPRTTTPGRIIAHRGASRVAPENTLAAFRAAAEQGAAWVEFDVALLGDGTAVLHHDEAFGRCTDRRGPLEQASIADVPAIDAGGWFGPGFRGEPLATLDQALELIGSLGLSANLEIKQHRSAAEAIAGAVAAALGRRGWAAGRIIVSSFEHETLAALRNRLPAQPLALLWEEAPADWADAVQALDASAIHLDWRCVEPALLEEADARGIDLRVYTINEPDRVTDWRQRGLTGVITDHPPLFLDRQDWAEWAKADRQVGGLT